ncbi:PAS domain-containing protein [Methylobacterium sp. J-048]|uniref:PAS domain-containing protein n=1 Tax=Methylobacterium sp. J-048 TaxID=2836635 RepID=UPI001FBA730D|nr:PAS domain-containing protein [Methylobacterium sp. J-048]MCJ2057902.1 PAS domain-containing protein [Methylobacterium sp. J-048]
MVVDAIKRTRGLPVDLSAALDASGVIGAWSWSPRTDQCTLDAGAAEVLAGDPGLAGRPIPLEIARSCIHPEDRPALVRHFQAVCERGGLFVAQYRTLSPSGQVRWILDRGRVPARASTRRIGHGLIIDVTDNRLDDAPSILPPVEPLDALSVAIDRALECRDALEGVADSELQLLIDMLLLRLGQSIAKAPAGTGARRGH